MRGRFFGAMIEDRKAHFDARSVVRDEAHIAAHLTDKRTDQIDAGSGVKFVLEADAIIGNRDGPFLACHARRDRNDAFSIIRKCVLDGIGQRLADYKPHRDSGIQIEFA